MTYPGLENDQALLATMNPDFIAVEQRRKEREEEFGEWVAVQPIPWGSVLAAIPGDPIPRDSVRRLKWDELGLVARRTSQAGRQVLERTGTATTEERERWKAEDKAAARKAAEAADAAKQEPASRGDKTPKGGAS